MAEKIPRIVPVSTVYIVLFNLLQDGLWLMICKEKFFSSKILTKPEYSMANDSASFTRQLNLCKS